MLGRSLSAVGLVAVCVSKDAITCRSVAPHERPTRRLLPREEGDQHRPLGFPNYRHPYPRLLQEEKQSQQQREGGQQQQQRHLLMVTKLGIRSIRVKSLLLSY
jgi:hypothetical protein